MKRLFALLICLSAILFFVACAETPTEPIADMTPGDEAAASAVVYGTCDACATDGLICETCARGDAACSACAVGDICGFCTEGERTCALCSACENCPSA